MTLRDFVWYLHKRTGYKFYYQSLWDGYAIYGFSDNFKGYIKKEKGKYYMLTTHHVSNAILTHPSISHKRMLHYKVGEYGYYGIYEISLQQDKATDS